MNYLQIAEVLKEKGTSSKDLAEAVSVSTTAMSAIVTGKSQPRFELLLKIANHLDVDIRDLFRATKETTSEPIYFKNEDGTIVKGGILY